MSLSQSSFSLKDRAVLITGASGGIGSVVASRLAEAGARVVLSGRSEERLAKIGEAILKAGGEAVWEVADLADPASVEPLIEAAMRPFGAVDTLVHVAGHVAPRPALEESVLDWDQTLNVNLRAAFLLSQALAPSMIEAGDGRIILVGSTAGIIGIPSRASYAASKGGLAMLTRQLAVEWGPSGIRTNCVAPTITLTPMAEKGWADPVKRQAMLEKIPLRRFASPQDVANAVVYLASPAGEMVNGVVLPVDGGLTAG